MYCENCGKEDLDYWIELPDGTIVCSEKCKKEWEKLCEELHDFYKNDVISGAGI